MDDDMFNLDDYENAPDIPEKKEEPKKNETLQEKIEEKPKETENQPELKEIIKEEESKAQKKEPEGATNKVIQSIPKEKDERKFATEDKIPVSGYDSIKNPAMTFPFQLDDFQKRGIIRVERHESVLVCAHTSSGKTVVAEYAIAKTKAENKRIIYTSPIKALSNQKFRDFKTKFEDVGVVTGDVSINPDAQCVIMTTEILQNMLYKQSEKLKSVDYIIFDEVHYINDRERGHVWEEILILLPNSIGLVMLSATVPNYLQFAQWIGSIKNTTIYVEITYKRVVPLEHKFYISGKKIFLFKSADDKVDESKIHEAIKVAEEENERIFKNRSKPQGKKEKKEREEKLFHQIKAYNQFLMKREKDKYNENGGKGNNTITQTHLKIEEIVNYVNKENLTPVVVFTFSIKKIDEYSKMLSSNQYITKAESTRIINFFDKCIGKLAEEDRKIGQIQAIRQLLPSGIGVHHAGLLPILKEIIEILYSKGLIKILFATTSFSIGLNMPTRTVVFTEITKYNEGKKEILSSSEYLQMCGRAGRRGIDDKGNVFILLGDKKSPPLVADISRMARGSGTSVESKFRLEYKTIIHFFYRNIKNIFDFFKESFIENSTLMSMPETRKRITQLRDTLSNTKPINCIYDIESIGDYHINLKQLTVARDKLFSSVFFTSLIKKGRVLLYYSKKQKKNIKIVVVNYYTDYNGEIWCLSVNDDPIEVAKYSKSKPKSPLDKYGVINNKFYVYITIFMGDVVDICDTIIKTAQKEPTIQDDDGFDFYKNLDPILNELNNANKQEAKIIDYMKVSKNDITVHGLLENKNLLNAKTETNNCHQCPLREEHYKQYEEISKLKNELEQNEKKLKEENLKCFKEFESRVKILKKLNYLDDENQLLLKGKAAKEISSADCILVTEFLLSNAINNLPIDELIAFLSGFITNQNGVNLQDPEISENFTSAINELEKIINQIKKIETSEEFEESRYNRRFNFTLAKPIQSWMNGSHFYQILDDCEIEEGKVFTLINRLTLFFDSICEFYKVLGNTTLGEKFVKAKEVLLREIMTTKSLYLEEDIDMDNI